MFGQHWVEIVVLLGLALLIFGPKRLPEIGGSLGRGIKEFRRATSHEEDKPELTAQNKDVHIPDPSAQTAAAERTAEPVAAEKKGPA